jgi:hypothetical protein
MTPMLPLHLGPLHPVEQALTLLLAFGPFVLLGIVIVVRRRQDARADGADPGQVNIGTTAPPRSPRS